MNEYNNVFPTPRCTPPVIPTLNKSYIQSYKYYYIVSKEEEYNETRRDLYYYNLYSTIIKIILYFQTYYLNIYKIYIKLSLKESYITNIVNLL